ncbi:ribokinase, partial [Saccharomonospora halophila]|uniref:ribokinase n=1 Tax=Saccharomonospora halophila TaxID=129922 RepID=UPI00037A7803
MEAHVLVVGSANIDLVVPARRRPGAGETVLGGDTVIHPGGKGANTAVAAARLGADVALLGAIGADEHGRRVRTSLERSGVDVSAVRHVRDRPTGVAYITVTPDGENSILVSPGANEALRPADVDEALPGAQLMVVSMEIPLETVEHALRAAARAGVGTVLNLSPVTGVSGAALGAVDVLLVNEHEAAWLLGSATGDRAPGASEERETDPRGLLDLGPRAAVVTSGAGGALVLTSAGDTRVPALPVRPVDTTGAGDAFAGALAATL